ncbi:pyridoxal-phosphate dependent enzyme [Pseudomonas sp. PA27(2017)]|uniref:pyridoxal-phosphate dependent enzyme n=1 Tax=Pseudomonas sp. PA27(2017) TaxID=1932112 RepID=UPI0009643278|nr:pyridoxal-phosphate dependent enzyme [Pseudomonas sp. PA27(2017)]OLU26447.1 serine dehydratase [Pseudomonas sp. PA27(2017)]
MSLSIKTPLLESLPLGRSIGTKVWMKMEAMQPSGSFKIRGVGFACEQHHVRGAQRFISSSGGNAGLAVAYAGRRLGVPVIVVVPETTTQRARSLLALEGAEVIVHGKTWFEANELARSMQTAADAFIHPFDDPLLWTGHASMIDEVVADGIRPDAVVLSVGGGGLLAGVDEGLRRNDLGDVPVYAVETEGTASLNASISAGQLVEIPAVSGVATSLAAKQVCRRAYELSKERPVIPVQVTDREAVDACSAFLNDHRILVEPACGASLAALYGNKMPLNKVSNVLVIVCGGSTATVESLLSFQG